LKEKKKACRLRKKSRLMAGDKELKRAICWGVARCILSHCGAQVSTPHSVGFARLASDAFYCAV